MEYHINWGKEGRLALPLPESWVVGDSLIPKAFSTPEDEKEVLRTALASPINSPALSRMQLKDKKILVVVDDWTRPTPVSLLFGGVYKELKSAGVLDKNIKIVVALGTHEAMSEEELKERLGAEIFDNLTVINHNCFDSSQLVYLGETAQKSPVWINRELASSDLVVLIGTIEPHPIAGFGGGLKNVIPGCAGMESIAATHLRGSATQRYTNVGKMGEEVFSRQQLEEGAQLFQGAYFLVNSVLTPSGKVAGIFCGHPIEAHRKGCLLASQIYGALAKEKADVLLVNSHPMDLDLRQGSKCLVNGLAVAKKDALLIAFMYCQKGVGDVIIRKPFLTCDLMQRFAREVGVERLLEIREELHGSLSDDERFMNQMLMEIARRHRVLVYSPNLPEGTGDALGCFEQFSDMGTLFKRARELAPEDAKAAIIPYGGITYARLA
jgi:lactate racemase